jgi:hypothetical protein
MVERSATAIAARGTRRCFGTRPAKLPIQAPLLKRPPRSGSDATQVRCRRSATNRRIARWQPWRNEAQKSPDARRRYRVGLVEKQTPSCSGMHKMRSRDGRSGQHRPPGRRTGIDRV